MNLQPCLQAQPSEHGSHSLGWGVARCTGYTPTDRAEGGVEESHSDTGRGLDVGESSFGREVVRVVADGYR